MYSTITGRRLPWWYSLGWEVRPPTLVLRLSRPFMEFIEATIKPDSPILTDFVTEYSLPPWKNTFRVGGSWGFGQAFRMVSDIKLISGARASAIFHLRIPRIKKPTGKPCEHCGGKRKDPFDRTRECYYCNGTGDGFENDWRAIDALAATLSVFTTLAAHFESVNYGYDKEVAGLVGTPQLLILSTILRPGIHGGSLEGSYSADLIAWLSENDVGEIAEAVQAMKMTWQRLWGGPSDDFENHYFFRAGCYLHPQQLLIDCPGNACGLHQGTDFNFKGNIGGYDFDCHNVDSAAQQLTLITALGAIEDRARREMVLQIAP